MLIRLTLKHQFSCLADQAFEVVVDAPTRVVIITSKEFDSSLLGWLVTWILPQQHGIVAFRDDNLGWVTPFSPYGLRVRVGADQGVEFAAQVVRLLEVDGGGVAVQLYEPRAWP